MTGGTFKAGAAQQVITPPIGTKLAGWSNRAAGDSLARFVHDDLFVRTLVVQAADGAWALVTSDLVGVDSTATGRIRRRIAQQTGLDPEAILVCGAHVHSGPALCPVAGAVSLEGRGGIRSDGVASTNYGQPDEQIVATAYYAGESDENWRDYFIGQAVDSAAEAWRSLRPAEAAYGEAEVKGVGSSRRVLLADGSWDDPRRQRPAEVEVVSRTEIDPLARVLVLRDSALMNPLAVVVNYGSHPWVFSTSGISGEMAGAVARKVAAALAPAGSAPPVVPYTTGPEGDVTAIWNIDLETVWRLRPDETLESGLARRERGFDRELDRLGGLLTEGVLSAVAGATTWDSAPQVSARRREILLPLKPGYRPPPELRLADWQAAPEGYHRTEIQVLRLGATAILALAGEPFVSIGRQIRAQAPAGNLIIAAISNDYGSISYIADQAAYAQGGYELTITPAAPGAGEVLAEQAAALLNATG